MSTSNSEGDSDLSASDRARIRAEEIYRVEVVQEIATSRAAPTGVARVVAFLNTSLGMWILGTVVLGAITFAYSNIQKSIENTRQEAIAEAGRADRERRLVSEIDSRIRRLVDLEWESPEESERALQRFLGGSEEAETEFGSVHLGTILHDLIGVAEDPDAPIKALERYDELATERARLIRFVRPGGGFPEQVLDAALRTRMQTQRFVTALRNVTRQAGKNFPLWDEEYEVFFELLPRRGDFVHQSIARNLFNRIALLAAQASDTGRDKHRVYLVPADAPARLRNAGAGTYLVAASGRTPLIPDEETPFRVNLHAGVITGEREGGEQVRYRVRIINATGSLLKFGGTYPKTNSNRPEDQLDSSLDYYRVSRVFTDVMKRKH